MKRWISLVLSVILLLGMFAPGAAATERTVNEPTAAELILEKRSAR